MTITRERFGVLPDGTSVDAFTLTNANGLSVRVLELGGVVQSVRTPDRHGRFGEIVLGYRDLDGYLGDHDYMGALIGRFAGRIAVGEIEIDGVVHRLSKNAGATTLHGGEHGFDKTVWRASDDGERLTLKHLSPDGDQGFPGELAVEAAFELTDADELSIRYRATTSRATVINLTHHGYWNLAGAGLVRDHQLRVDADAVLETDAELIPSGALRPVADTPLDLRAPRRLGDVIDAAGGVDHTFALAGHAARLTDPSSGRVLEIWTTEPALTVYTANGFDPAGIHPSWSGVALETGHFPDSPHHTHFPSTVLRPSQAFHSTTIYRFGWRDRQCPLFSLWEKVARSAG